MMFFGVVCFSFLTGSLSSLLQSADELGLEEQSLMGQMTRLQSLKTKLEMPDEIFAGIKKHLKKKKDGVPPTSEVSWLITEV